MGKPVIIFLLLLQVTASAQPLGFAGGNTSRTYALVVGISNYQDEAISNLSYADRDAGIFAEFLQSGPGGALGADQIRLLTNADATLARIQAGLEWLMHQTRPGDQAIFYFAGHGDVETRNDTGKGYLLAHDTPKNNYRLNAIDLDFLNHHINELSERGAKVLVITDACHSGTLAGNSTDGREATARELMRHYANEIKILSCQPYELSQEGTGWGDGRGVFSYYLIEALQGGRADTDGSQFVDLYELEDFLQDHVRKATGKQQHPEVFGGLKRDPLFLVDQDLAGASREKEKSELQENFEQAVLNRLATRKGNNNYVRFIDAIDRGRLLFPEQRSAYTYYQQLRSDTTFLPLRGIMDERLVVALLDSVQQAILAYLNADPEELAQRARFDRKYHYFPEYLQRAADILGPEDARYRPTLAKQYYFEGLALRLDGEQQGGMDSLYQMALDKQQKALTFEQDAAYIYNELGWLLLELGRTEEGITHLQRAIEIAPTWAIPYNNLAIAYKQQEQLELSKEMYLKAISLKPDFSSAYANLGNLFYVQEQPDSAEIMYLRSIELGPNYKENHFNLGLLLSGDETRQAEAESLYRRVLEIEPDYPEAFFELGNLYDEMGQPDSAETMYLKAIALKPDYAEAYRNCGFFYESQNRSEDAEKMYLGAVRVRPTFADVYVDLEFINPESDTWKVLLDSVPLNIVAKIDLIREIAFTFFSYQSYENALEAFRLALSLDRSRAESYYWLSVYYALRGEEKAALKNLKQTLKKAKSVGEDYYPLIDGNEYFSGLENDKKFQELMQRFFAGRS
ncbi:MAG: tetratricopeptide repeat protein [Saprospiraceae bacterium]|nr:tetratricopeptide repeat protein [Lewinella sp.]